MVTSVSLQPVNRLTQNIQTILCSSVRAHASSHCVLNAISLKILGLDAPRWVKPTCQVAGLDLGGDTCFTFLETDDG